MPEMTNALEALHLISDWSKWLVTIETFAIALLGSLFTTNTIKIPQLAKVFGTISLVSFVVSIAAAAMLLLTLPEIAQNLKPNVNIWMTKDSIAYNILKLNTQSLAVIESFSFGLGIIFAAAVIAVIIWAKPNETSK